LTVTAPAPPADAAEYRRTVRREFAALKAIDRYDELVAKSLRLRDGQGYLLCVSELFAGDGDAVETLARFRAGVTTFPGTFRVTAEGTNRWLRAGLLDVPDRILFFVLGRAGQVVGHLGFAHADNAERLMELDNVIRGVAAAQPGLMSAAAERLIEWAAATFAPAGFRLRVLEGNDHAIRFYERLGFARDGLEPLRRQESDGETRYVPVPPGDAAPPDLNYLRMRLAAPAGAAALRRSA
jgi:RimJ/RimL family protein N-acetyltransferase